MDKMGALANNSEASLRYLENVADAESREEVLRNAGEQGMEGISLASVSHLKTFHSGQELSPAAGIARNEQGRIFISDEFNHRIIVYNREFLQEESFGTMGGKEGEFHYPRGLTVNGEGDLYVADAWNHRVVVFDKNLSFKTVIGKLGTDIGELDEPVAVVWINGRNGGGHLAVLEKSNHRVQLFDASGTSLGAIGARGSVAEQEQFYITPTLPEVFCTPVFEFPSAMAADKHGNLYVADTNNHRVVKITEEGAVDTSYAPLGLKYPVGAACDEEDNLHITCFNFETVSVFSPDGVLLYRYAPKETELPVSIAISDGNVYVAGGMKASVSVHALEPEHEKGMARENPFWRHFKTALSLMRDGDADGALRHLEQAATTTEKPTAREFADALPENDYFFHRSDKEINGEGSAEKFGRLLGEFSEEIFCEIAENLERKVDGVDKYTEATLRLESSLIHTTEPDDARQVERFRSIKKVFVESSKLRNRMAGFKKLQELWQRFSYYGLFTESRLAQLKLNFERFTHWKRKREKWYEAAEKEAPSLSFNSLPDERTRFAQNEARLEMISYEFRVLWNLASDQNRELASLIRRKGSLFSPLCGELILKAVDFFIFCPDDFTTRFDYLLSLQEIFDAAGGDGLDELMRPFCKEELLAQLGREDKIPQTTGADVYRLMPALWGGGKLEHGEMVDAEPWDKIVDFYHAEFRRFINENSPLRTELLRNEQMLPAAEKADAKQAAILCRKLGLLRFHNYFQERYIGNIMAEYLVRFALFALKNSPVTKEQAKRTEKELNELIEETLAARLRAGWDAAGLREQAEAAKDTGERNNLLLKSRLRDVEANYNKFLSAHLLTAQGWVARHLNGIAVHQKRNVRFSGNTVDSEPVFLPSSSVFGANGDLFILMHGSGRVCVLDARGRFKRSFAGYGNLDSNLRKPMGIVLTPGNELLISEFGRNSLALFSQEGRFLRRFKLKGAEGRTPFQLQFDSAGRLFASFMDGKGVSIYDLNGNFLSVPENIKKDGAFQPIENLCGFCIKEDRFITAGNGEIIVTDLEGNEARSLTSTETVFEAISSVDVDANGNIYIVDFKRNLLLKADAALKEVKPESISTLGLCRVSCGDNALALSDYIGNAIQLLRFE